MNKARKNPTSRQAIIVTIPEPQENPHVDVIEDLATSN